MTKEKRVRHEWNVTETTDTCALCGLVRRTIAHVNGLHIYRTVSHEFFNNGVWRRPMDTMEGKYCPQSVLHANNVT